MRTSKTNVQDGFITTADGIDLHWELTGSGPPLICCNGVGVSTFFWKYIVARFQSEFSILLWDYRGHGSSQRELSHHDADLSIHRHALDLSELVQELFPSGAPATVLGHSMGCQVGLEYTRLFPDRVCALVLMLGTAGRALDTFANNPNSPLFFRAVKRAAFSIGPKINRVTGKLLLSRAAWPFTTRLSLVDPLYTTYEDFYPYLSHLSSMNFLLFLEAAWQCQLHDAWDLLPELEVPLLMIAADRDAFTPLSCANRLVSSVPGAEMMILAEGTHAALIEQPDTINVRLARFFAEHGVAGPPQ
jgi:pimeloyl-ACP methyl ester carboxylesterase